MIYIDIPTWQKSGAKSRKKYSHLIADSLQELHEFALKIKIKKHFFHSSAKIKHYDVAEEMFQIAVDAGAVIIDSREIVKLGREMK